MRSNRYRPVLDTLPSRLAPSSVYPTTAIATPPPATPPPAQTSPASYPATTLTTYSQAVCYAPVSPC